jgi:lipopolysaccharide/colanic/teichoic acid biosynthesis glycosyltransferase
VTLLLWDHVLGGWGAPRQSLLALPLGSSTVLDQLIRRLSELGGTRVLVATPGQDATDGSDQVLDATEHAIELVDPAELATVFADCEAEDRLIAVDPAWWPSDDYAFLGDLDRHRLYRGAMHFVPVGADVEGTRERVRCDSTGRVVRVERLYNGVSWPEDALNRGFLSIVPLKPLSGKSFDSMRSLRRVLAESGVLSQDMPLHTDAVDLRADGGMLALNEHLLTERLSRSDTPDYERREGQVLVAPGCRVHPRARLVGPVLLQRDVMVDEGATVVGPAVLGRAAHVQSGAMVAQCVLAARTEVESGMTLRQCLAWGDHPGWRLAETPAASAAAPALDLPAEWTTLQGELAAPTDLRRFRRRVHLGVKRAVDIAFSATALLILSPLVMLAAILIKLDSPGPVLFVHRRERRGGAQFPCYKFRTMEAGAHGRQRDLYRNNAVDGPQFKLAHDPRITRVGRWLRATNIDELPQLINVLLGHMSLVGPRPSPFRENQICVPWRRARLSVRPGITGLWQICRSDERAGGDFQEWIYYDIAYVQHFTVWLDLRIFLATIISLGGQWRVPLSWMLPQESPQGSPTPTPVVS